MVCRFMNGIDPQFEQFYEETFTGLLIENTRAILDVLELNEEELNKHQSSLEKAVSDSLDMLEKVRDRFQKEFFSDSVIEMASRLPRDELAHMAESLVNLTSLQRKVSPNIETVGGAVDVAVISKGDGFVWIKRKHYFPDKNLQFVKSYLSEYTNVKGEHDDKMRFAENKTLRDKLFHDLPEYFDESAIISAHVARAVKLANEEFKRSLEQHYADKDTGRNEAL
eukprot:CAMPEP_0195246708 /NCGR_PEP_ID=MMETSP0706-20130129/545_1 /TAXON_ID=33640 /ORGANISM="Asterionellopsis glacialis, Strain CCMP134" /LENGTH=223 /DNA_ID=CAMNT_0040298099 /DNA_START=1003 /DNA_END=1675 /DNA_ORIENTATION=+